MATNERELFTPIRGRLIFAVVLAAVASLCALVPLVAVAFIARTLLDGGSTSTIVLWTAIGIAGAIARVVLNGVATSISHFADADFRASVRTRIVDHLAQLPLGWFGRNGAGEVKKAIGDDVRRMHVVVAHLAVDLTSGIVTPIAGTVILGIIDWRLMLAFVGYLAIVSGFTLPAAARSMTTYYGEYDAAVAATSLATVELVDGIEVVKAFETDARESGRFHAAVDRWAAVCLAWTRAGSRPASLLGILTSPASMTTWVLGVGIAFVALGWSEAWAIVPFLLIGVGVPGSFQQLGAMTSSIRQAAVAARHVRDILSEAPLPAAIDPQTPSDASVELRDITFTYPGSTTPALAHVSLHLEPGTVTALVGSSGSGKSTIARLIPRFYDVDDGAILVGGVDVRTIDQSTLLRQIAIVFQDATLVAGTLRDNLRLARPDASDQDVMAAVRSARLEDVVARLPDGLDTRIGSGGVDVSGGERQRITVARAIVQDAPIVLLDEATAHVDPHGEVAVQRALAALAQGRTLLVIAHRLHTIQDADQIVVLHDGHVAERGTHDDLMLAEGRYAALFDIQTRNEETVEVQP